MKKNSALNRLLMVLVFLFLYAPIFLLIIFSFNAGDSSIVWKGFSLHWYEKLFNNRIIMQSLYTTLLVSFLATIIATIAIYASVGQWNAWFDNHIYCINNKNLETLQYLLYKYMQEAQHIMQEIKEKNPGMKIKITPRGVRMTITMITTIPVLCIYPFLQRYLIKGLLIGAVKG